MDLISILTTVYNKEEWLPRYFKSLEQQTYSNLEFVVVDNGSTDNSLDIMKSYALKDPRIKIIRIQINNGPAKGYQTAINNISGKYFTIIDADDYIDPDYIEKLYKSIVKYDADMAMCVNDIVYETCTAHKPWPSQDENFIDVDQAKLLPFQLLDEYSDTYMGFHMPEIGAPWNKLYKASLVKDNNINYLDGLWTWCDFVFNLEVVLNVKKFIYIRSVCYHFCQSSDSETRSFSFNKLYVQRLIDSINAIDKICCKINTHGIKYAENRWLLDRVHAAVFYFLHYYNEGIISKHDFNLYINQLLSTSCIENLIQTRDVANLSKRDILFLYTYKYKRCILTVRKFIILYDIIKSRFIHRQNGKENIYR